MARTAPALGRGRQVLAGLGALAVVAVVVALPFLLVWAAGNPLPVLGDWLGQLIDDPSAAGQRLWEALTSRDDGDLFLRALAVVGWVAAALATWGWATFLVAFVVEFVAQLRGRRLGRIPRRTVRLPGLRLQQKLAAALVAAIIGIVASPALSAAAVAPHGATPAAAAPHVPAAPAALRPASGPALAVTAPAAPVAAGSHASYLAHPVQRGESLLDIAEQYRVPWQRVAEATQGVVQPDGRSLQPGSTRVYPGWTVRIPAAPGTAAPATIPAAATATQSGPPMVYEVARGDWLWHVADRFLGEPTRWTEIAGLNPQLEHLDGRFPDHIEGGWTVRLPADAHDRGARPHASGTLVAPAAPVPGPADPGSGPVPPGQVPTPPGPAAPPGVPSAPPTASASPSATAGPSASGTPPNSAGPAPGAQPTAPTATAPTATAPSEDDGSDSGDRVVIGALTGAGLLSALLLAAVFRRRRRQRQHRRHGRRLPHPRGGATERALRVAEQPADVDRLDIALRSLAADLAARDPALLPDIAGAWIVGGDVSLVLTGPCPDPPTPWTGDGNQWTLPGDVPLPAVDDQLAPLPTLAAVGSQPGRHLLLDLERLGSLTIGGDADRALALLRYLASELACNAWSDEVDVIVAGFPVEETELLVALNPDRVRPVSSVAEAAGRLRRRVGAITAALGHTDATDTLAGRVTDVGEAWAPQVLLVADPTDADLPALDDLAQVIAAAGRCAVAVATSSHRNGIGTRHAITVTADGALHIQLPFLHTSAAAAGLPVGELEPLAEIMAQARAAVDEPTPAAPEPEGWAADTDAAGAILNLYGAGTTPAAPQPAAPDSPPPVDLADDPWAVAEPEEPPTAAPPTTQPAPRREPILDIPSPPATVAAAVTAPRREVTAAVRQRRRQADPHLDADLKAWRDQDPTRPRIGILGPVTVDAPGPVPDLRRRFHAEIIVFLAQRGARGVTGDQLSTALWPDQTIKDASRRVAITRARRWLGETPSGDPWLPEMGSDRVYKLEPGYLLDWHLFRRLRSRGEAHGPAGVKDLRAALELVRGVPLDGADRAYAAGARNPFTWLPESDIYPGHIVSAVVDTSHQLAELYLEVGDTTSTRWAVQRAWLADPYRGDDEPWHDLMRAAHMEGHASELRNLLGELMRVREAEVPEDLSPHTYAWLRPLLPDVLSASTPAS